MTRRDWLLVIAGWMVGGFVKGFIEAALAAKGCR